MECSPCGFSQGYVFVRNYEPLRKAPIGPQNLAVDPRTVGARKERHDVRDILRLAQPFERR
jgi:hypothetical protein